MAFTDRGLLWEHVRQTCGAELEGTAKESYFCHGSVIFIQPGIPPEFPRPPSHLPCINIDRSGPDGKGEDPRIKSAAGAAHLVPSMERNTATESSGSTGTLDCG